MALTTSEEGSEFYLPSSKRALQVGLSIGHRIQEAESHKLPLSQTDLCLGLQALGVHGLDVNLGSHKRIFEVLIS